MTIQESLSELSDIQLIRLRRKVYRHDLFSIRSDYRSFYEAIENAIDEEFLSRLRT